VRAARPEARPGEVATTTFGRPPEEFVDATRACSLGLTLRSEDRPGLAALHNPPNNRGKQVSTVTVKAKAMSGNRYDGAYPFLARAGHLGCTKNVGVLSWLDQP
jgi:hypothetical protein